MRFVKNGLLINGLALCTGIRDVASFATLHSSYQRTLTTGFSHVPKMIKSSRQIPQLNMALIPMTVNELQEALVLGVPTGDQYSTYWGRTSRERYNAMFESASVTFLGLFASYFLSFVIGSPVATFLGTVAAFWTLLGPELKAYQRNWELIGGRPLVNPTFEDDYDDDFFDSPKDGLRGAYFVGCIQKVAVVEHSLVPSEEEYDLLDFQDYTMETDENELALGQPWMLRLSMGDSSGRNMQVHARMSEDYLDIEEGMPCVCILLSTNERFDVLAGLTDVYIPDAGCFVGDYPYMNKFALRKQLDENDELLQVLDDEDEFWNDVYLNRVNIPRRSSSE